MFCEQYWTLLLGRVETTPSPIIHVATMDLIGSYFLDDSLMLLIQTSGSTQQLGFHTLVKVLDDPVIVSQNVASSQHLLSDGFRLEKLPQKYFVFLYTHEKCIFIHKQCILYLCLQTESIYNFSIYKVVIDILKSFLYITFTLLFNI